jgi:hypothetical protein
MSDDCDYSFVFVCQSGELEIKSLLLAASLRQHLPSDTGLIAAIPSPSSVWGDVSDLTYDQLDELRVTCQPIENMISNKYPIGNKLSAIGVETDADFTVFLDSDILCLSPFSPQKEFCAQYCVKPADRFTYNNSEAWEELYRIFDLPLPVEKIKATESNENMWPYYNAGVISVKNGMEFSRLWAKCCQKIFDCDDIPDKLPWLDQLGLPIVMKLLNQSPFELTEKLNYPAHIKPMHSSDYPHLCHYHFPFVIAREPRLMRAVHDILMAYPKIEKTLKKDISWGEVLP